MAATTVVGNPFNNNQPFGSGGGGGVGYSASMECPAGSYITQVTGHAGADVNQIENVKCLNVVTGQTTGPQQVNTLGHNGSGNAVDITCNAGTDSLLGFNIDTSLSNQLGQNVVGLQGTCAKFPSGGQYGNGGWGAPKTATPTTCPPGYQVYKLSGGGANGQHGYLAGFSYECKSLGGASTINGNNVSRGKCIVGDDKSGDCAEIKGILSGQGSKETDVRSYCAQGSNILLPNCSSYYNNDPGNTYYQDIMIGPSGYCTQGTNFTTNLCTNFCTASTGNSLPDGKKDVCNTLYEQKCAVPPANGFDICNSLQPFSSYPGAALLPNIPAFVPDPMCYFAEVVAHGYRKAPTSTLGCPACVQNQTITIADSTDAAISNVVQSCNVSNNTSAPAAPTTPAASTTPLANSLNSSSPSATTTPATTAPAKILGMPKKTFIIVLIIVIVVICCCSSSAGGGLALSLQ